MTAEVEPKPAISKAVARGDLASVQRIIDAVDAVSLDEKIKVVNYARKWTEHNISYEAEDNPNAVAEWYDVTPITLAAMRGHDSIVEYLLQQGADPTLKGCSLDDIIVELSNDENLTVVDLPELHMNAFDAANKLTNKIRCCRRTRDLLMVVKVRMGNLYRLFFRCITSCSCCENMISSPQLMIAVNLRILYIVFPPTAVLEKNNLFR